MKSTIRIDFQGMDVPGQKGYEPVIRVNLEDSEDVRDGLLHAFFDKLGGDSSWLVVNFYEQSIDGVKQPRRISITPIEPSELEKTIETMKDRLINIQN